ncbi:LamG domain-containing protein [Jatrophihabitans endophyticus]|uniref:LamG domain-containing protein n=1 Tax=Jatrophihabitans endophyticus TaxID=1206085 RepID=UPI001A03E92C|nr:LamG domain-containing protein [Jatrophihabitans endophyticus]MBE7188978.1 hypothetical protein [Jatrophihabitans endophyticus]
MTPPLLRRGRRLVLCACAVFVVVLAATVQFSYGGLSASLSNPVGSSGSGTLLLTHSYSGNNTCSSVPSSKSIPSTSTFSCLGSIAPTNPAPSSGSVSAVDSISDQGSATAAQVTQTVAATSCAPVQLANIRNTSNPLLARYGTTFSTDTAPATNAGSVTLDGATPGGYESSVVSQSQPTTVGGTYGYGIFFKTTSTAGGSLFGFGSSPADVTGSSNDRILYMTAAGKLVFLSNTSGSALSTTRSYNDGTWHFAYVTVSPGLLGAGTTKLTVDDYSPASATNISYNSYAGYWHVGWSPAPSVPDYFNGSLSNFVVFDGLAGAPAQPTAAQRASQAAFNTWASSATELWPMNDNGTDTFAGPYPLLGTTSPCGAVNVSWATTNPTSCGYSPNSKTAACTDPPTASLSSFVSAGPQTVASAAPGTTQTSTIKLSRGSGYNTNFDPGLHLYAPLTFTASAGSWVNTFSWSSSSAVFIG